VTAVRAVLFDLGGVLTDSPMDSFAAYEAAAGLPAGLIRRLNATDPDTNAWARFERGELDVEEFIAAFEEEREQAGHVVDAGRAHVDALPVAERDVDAGGHEAHGPQRCRARGLGASGGIPVGAVADARLRHVVLRADPARASACHRAGPSGRWEERQRSDEECLAQEGLAMQTDAPAPAATGPRLKRSMGLWMVLMAGTPVYIGLKWWERRQADRDHLDVGEQLATLAAPEHDHVGA